MVITDKGAGNHIVLAPTATIDEATSINFNGNNNTIILRCGAFIKGAHLNFSGSGHTLLLEEKAELHTGLVAFENNDNLLHIGKGSRVYAGYQIAVCEPSRRVVIGAGCLFSGGSRIRTTDSHSIWDSTTNTRINRGKSIVIEDNVWVSEAVHILKGSHIGNNSVIGAGSIVTGKTYPPHSIIAGNPAKVVKSNIYWKEERDDT